MSDDGFVSAARLESHMATNMKTSVGGTHQKLFQNGFKDEFSVVGSVARKNLSPVCCQCRWRVRDYRLEIFGQYPQHF